MTSELVTIPQNDSPYAIMPVLDVRQAMARRQAVLDYTRDLMNPGVDFGVIPGTGDKAKPTLLKPGAEKLASLFGLSPLFEIVERDLDWTGEAHGGEPFFYIQYRCTLTRGELVAGQGLGSCNSWEKKYRWRNVYPEKATAEDKERGRLETRTGRNNRQYQVYIVKNPDPADVVNTIDKMAQKRALVAAVLIAVNASELFTQDVEDYSDVIDGDWQPATTQVQPTRPAPAKPAAQPAAAPVDNGPLPDDEQAVYDAPGAEFVPKVAEYLHTDEANVKAHMKRLGHNKIPGIPKERLAIYRQLRGLAERDAIDNLDDGNGNSGGGIQHPLYLELPPAEEPPAEEPPATPAPLFTDDPDAVQAGLATAQGQMD